MSVVYSTCLMYCAAEVPGRILLVRNATEGNKYDSKQVPRGLAS